MFVFFLEILKINVKTELLKIFLVTLPDDPLQS